jgi:branched-subunit amino acid ABC-type transport system permease component
MVYVIVLASIYDAGLLFSIVIALLTTGFILTNIISGFPNLGHTLNLGVGMIFSFLFSQITNTSPVIAIPVSLILTGIYSLITYILVFKRIKKPELASLAGLGLLLAGSKVLVILQGYLRVVIDTTWWCGHASIEMEMIHFHYPRNRFFGVHESTLVSLFLILLISTIYLIIKKKGIWVHYLAYMENPELTQLMGVDPEKIRNISWFIAGGLGGIAGTVYPFVFKGYPGGASEGLTVVVFASATFAGMNSPKFGFLAGLVVGFLDIILLTLAQYSIGVWFGDFSRLIPLIILVGSFYIMGKQGESNARAPSNL